MLVLDHLLEYSLFTGSQSKHEAVAIIFLITQIELFVELCGCFICVYITYSNHHGNRQIDTK